MIREEKFLDEDKKPCRRFSIIDNNERHYYYEQDDQGNWRMFGRYSRGEIFSQYEIFSLVSTTQLTWNNKRNLRVTNCHELLQLLP